MITNVGEDVEELEPCVLLVGMEILQALWKTIWRFPPKLKIDLLYDPTIALLCIYPKELYSRSQNDICTPMSIAQAFTTAKTCEEPKCPSMNE